MCSKICSATSRGSSSPTATAYVRCSIPSAASCACPTSRANLHGFAERAGTIGRHDKRIKEPLENILARNRRAREEGLTLC